MAVDLKVNQDAFTQAITNLEGSRDDLQTSYLKIFEQVHMLEKQEWSGAASDQFHAKFDELYANIRQIESVMTNIVNMLKTVLNIVTEAESRQTSTFTAADAGVAYL